MPIIAGRILDRAGATTAGLRVEALARPSTLAHRSTLVAGMHQHFFFDAEALRVFPGELLVAYVFLDPAAPPRAMMLQWHDNGWEHRACWGEELFTWGVPGTASQRHMGPLPPAGRWIRLEVPASLVDLEGGSIHGLAFTLFDGRATWDHAGKAAQAGLSPAEDTLWVEDALPPGAVPQGDNESWEWSSIDPLPFSAPGTELLAATEVGADGHFTLEVDDTQLAARFVDRPAMLVFGVYQEDRLLASTENTVVWRADLPSEVQITVELPPVPAQPAEYAHLHQQVAPFLQDWQLANLSHEEVILFAAAHDIVAAHMVDLWEATRLSGTTGLPAATFYAFLRRDLPRDLDRLLARPLAELQAALEAALAHNLLPACFGDTLPDLVRRLGQLQAGAAPLASLAEATQVAIPPELAVFLADGGIDNLASLRAAGPLSHVDGLPVPPDAPAVRMLDAQAALSLLPTDLALNARLMAAGYTSLADIAHVPAAAFLAAVVPAVASLEQASAIHAAAVAQVGYLGNLIAGLRAGDGPALPLSVPGVGTTHCTCEECRSALGKLAYLADLLDYAVRHLHAAGQPVTLTALETRFHQPFRGLPASCAALEPEIRQVRIVIEVLRQHLPTSLQNHTPRWYLEQSYFRLLEEIGTTFDEVRQARGLDATARKAIGDRLMVGVDAQPGHHDHLDELFIDPSQLSEGRLHQLFGLRDSTLDPLQPDPAPGVLIFRRRYLRQQWRHAGWTTGSAQPATLPIIDPDVIGLAHISDHTPTNPVYQLYVSRERWVEQTLTQIEDYRNDPTIGLDGLLRDGQYGLGSRLGASDGPGVADLLALRLRRQHGAQIDTELQRLLLSVAAFDALSEVVALHDSGAGVIDAEWQTFSSILLQRLKERDQFASWRQAEAAVRVLELDTFVQGLSLSPDHFRLRPSPADADPGWVPAAWRATWELRMAWVETLQAHIQQEQEVYLGLARAVDVVEEALLAPLRHTLLVEGGLAAPDTIRRLTDTLQIDFASEACQKTSRVDQAIATLQGTLWGARYGLLEGGDLSLQGLDFDDEWKWLGSYGAWRAAMLVFLHPESALRPTLRQPHSTAFGALVHNLRSSGRTTPDLARAQADQYARYFADVATLEGPAIFTTASPLGSEPDTAPAHAGLRRHVMALARAAASGRFYASSLVQHLKPSIFAGVAPVVERTEVRDLWRPLPDLPGASAVAGLLPYWGSQGSLRLGAYFQARVQGSDQVLFTHFDGTTWTKPALVAAMPAVTVAAHLDAAALAPDPVAAGAGVSTVALDGNEHLVSLDLDGDGRKELLAFASTPQAGAGLSVTMLRAWDGGLALGWRGSLPPGWRLPDPNRPVILRSTLPAFPWRADRLLLVKDSVPEIGVAGWQPGAGLVLLYRTSDPGGWPVRLVNQAGGATLPTVFAAASLDGGAPQLLAFTFDTSNHIISTVKTGVAVLDWSGERLSVRRVQDLEFEVDADQSHATASDDYDIRWDLFLPVQTGFGPNGNEATVRQDILVFARRMERIDATIGRNRFETVHYLGTLRWDRLQNRFPVSRNERRPWYYSDEVPGVAGQASWPLDPGDQWYAFDTTRAAPKQHILVFNPARLAIAFLGYASNGRLQVAWQSSGRIPHAGNLPSDWLLEAGDRFLPADFDGDGVMEILIASQDGRRLGLVRVNADLSLAIGWMAQGRVEAPDAVEEGWRLAPAADTQFQTADLDGDGAAELTLLTRDRRIGVLRAVSRPQDSLSGLPVPIRPRGVTLREIHNQWTPAALDARRTQVQAAYQENRSGAFATSLVYLDEAYFFVPMELGVRLRESGYYAEALDWFRTVYRYEAPLPLRKIPSLLAWEETLDASAARAASWLADALNPHRIAATRRNSYTRYTLLCIVDCLLDYADSEFSRNSAESLPRARELYETALALLRLPVFEDGSDACQALLNSLPIRIGEDEERWVWEALRFSLQRIADSARLAAVVDRVREIMVSGQPRLERYQAARQVVEAALQANPAELDLAAVLARNAAQVRRALATLSADGTVAGEAARLGVAAGGGTVLAGDGTPHFGVPVSALVPALPAFWEELMPGRFRHELIPAPSFDFCIPPNPALASARRRAETSLARLRACQDITGAPQPGALTPTPYRFAALVERAKELVRVAGQVESAMLAALEHRDEAYYNMLIAQQNLQLTQAGQHLQVLQLNNARRRVILADQQQQRALLQARTYAGWIQAGLNDWEKASIRHHWQAIVNQELGTVLGAWGGALANLGPNFAAFAGASVQFLAAIFTASAETNRLRAQVASIRASHERSKDGWELARQTAEADAMIAGTQLLAARDEVHVQEEELAVAALRATHAEAIVDFLSRKFTSFDLYDWMSDILARVYRYFLLQATATAQAAARQLAFERQEPVTGFILPDYWLAPSAGAPAQERQGLTGSARLTQDLYQLDQYAFQISRLKQQLVKTLSLAQLDPYAFEQFRQSGQMHFTTPMVLFDRDFPGHYLRLIRQVRTSVIALIPPVQGIRATLASSGISRVVVQRGRDFVSQLIRRAPQVLALTSPLDATGLFQMEAPSALLLPFEGSGVDTTWEFTLPRASNPFDFGTIADVLLTIEYTALDSVEYRVEIMRRLANRTLVAERAFSFRRDFADAWYDLLNPDTRNVAVAVQFETRPADFPPNLRGLRIERVVLHFVHAQDRAFAVPVERLIFTPAQGQPVDGGAGLSDSQGTLSSRDGGGAAGWDEFRLKTATVFGRWELVLLNQPALRQHFANGDIEDILMIITYTGLA